MMCVFIKVNFQDIRRNDYFPTILPMRSFVTYTPILFVFALALKTDVSHAQNPPDAPIITEPARDDQIVNPADVHMETAPMRDSDPGDTHDCSDWEIRTEASNELIWEATCISGVEKTHLHLGDGNFTGSYAGRPELDYETSYRLRVRHRDHTGLWSPFAERAFRTGSPAQIFALELADIAASPAPSLVDETGMPLILPSGNRAAAVRVESNASHLFLTIQGMDGNSNEVINPAPLGGHYPIRVVIGAGNSMLNLPLAQLLFTDGDGVDHTIYLPPVTLAASNQAYFWISAEGSSFTGTVDQMIPSFSHLAQGAPVPWRVASVGYQVEVVAKGLQLPVNIAFKPEAGTHAKDPYFYVTELYGSIKVVTVDGTVSDYATNLLNFEPTGDFPGSGEQGLSGIVVEPVTGDVFVSMLYDAAPSNGPHYPKVVRFHSNDGGLTAATQTTILEMPGESQGQSHFVSSLSIGPEGKLYVHMGDGFDARTALNLNSFRGKILRVNLDGTPPADNPFYNTGDGINSEDYVFAYGFRNPFGGAWRASDGFLYEVENGPDRNDRFAKVERGVSYGWNGSGASMSINAIYNWTPPRAPANIAFVQTQTFSGSGFPVERLDRAFVTESGPTWASGPQALGKRIVEFVLEDNGRLRSGPNTFVEYIGSGKATAVGLAAGPGGLYFTDLYKDQDYASPIDRGARVLRVKFVGYADFKADVIHGYPPFTVQFTDLSSVPAPAAWLWRFGDGDSSTAQNPIHTYTKNGEYNVRLTTTGVRGAVIAQKNAFITAGGVLRPGLKAEYYDNIDFTGAGITRTDLTVNFNWAAISPDPKLGVDDFSVRWAGFVEPAYSEPYTFSTLVDDGVRLWIDDQLLIDAWYDQVATSHSGTITLSAGRRYRLKMEYYERGGLAVARLLWASPSQAQELIPKQRLHHTHYSTASAERPPATFSLQQNYPNPFSAESVFGAAGTVIEFSLPAESRIQLKLYDVLGREVTTLIADALYQSGDYAVRWEGANAGNSRVESGLYFYKLIVTSRNGELAYSATRKIVFLQ